MYEYKIQKVDIYPEKRVPQAEQILNELAEDGWEPFMVTSSHLDLSQTVFLRRPKADRLL